MPFDHLLLERDGEQWTQSRLPMTLNLVLGARRVEQLASTAELVKQAGRTAYTQKTDVADPDQPHER